MIKGVHAMFYSSKSEQAREFIKEKLRLPYSDVGEGWLIFDLKEGDVGFHPTEGDPPSGTHNVSFYCDNLEKTVKELKSRGVTFDDGIADHGYGFVTHLTMPGGVKIQIYQPKYVKRAKSKNTKKKKVVARKGAGGAAKAARRSPKKRARVAKRK
jgi:predicted enzyme related to lactoylglutathione lyase